MDGPQAPPPHGTTSFPEPNPTEPRTHSMLQNIIYNHDIYVHNQCKCQTNISITGPAWVYKHLIKRAAHRISDVISLELDDHSPSRQQYVLHQQ